MGVLKTLVGWATGAWDAITGAAGNPLDALTKLWHYVTSVHGLLAWIAGNPILQFYRAVLGHMSAIGLFIGAVRDVLRRLATWIWGHQVRPVRDQLAARITALRAWAVQQFSMVLGLIQLRYLQALAYTDRAVGMEHVRMVLAVMTEHAHMLAGDKATLATVQREAAGAYRLGVHSRIGIAGDLLDDLITRTPAIKDLVNYVIAGALRLADIEDPVLGWLVGKAVDEITARVGVDQLAAQAVQSLLGPVIGQPPPADLAAVVKAMDGRIAALERSWADFMKDGGPEVEQAGKEWKGITGLAADAGILGMVALAVTEPAAWSAGIADTIGTVADDALTAIVDLIGRA